MPRSAHLETPTAEQIRDLLERCGWSCYKAAPLIGYSARALQKCVAGDERLRGSGWLLLRIMASESARAALPPAVLP